MLGKRGAAVPSTAVARAYTGAARRRDLPPSAPSWRPSSRSSASSTSWARPRRSSRLSLEGEPGGRALPRGVVDPQEMRLPSRSSSAASCATAAVTPRRLTRGAELVASQARRPRRVVAATAEGEGEDAKEPLRSARTARGAARVRPRRSPSTSTTGPAPPGNRSSSTASCSRGGGGGACRLPGPGRRHSLCLIRRLAGRCATLAPCAPPSARRLVGRSALREH